MSRMEPFCFHIAFIVGILITIFPQCIHAVGNLPDGVFSSDELTAETVDDMHNYCDSIISCAGMTYRPTLQDEEEEYDWLVYFHSFIPPLLNNSDQHDWVTERSPKSFVLHPGKLLPMSNSTTGFSSSSLDLQVDPSSLSLKDAQDLCLNHAECVAFSYPLNNSHLNGFDEILFSSSVDNLDTSLANWQTFVVNQDSKASKANADILRYYQVLEENPYSTCCDKATTTNDMPSLEQVQAMDTLPRISCDISRREFLAQYEFTRTPVMLEGCTDEWPAMTEWTLEKLTKRFEHDNETTWRVSSTDAPQDFELLPWMEVMSRMGQNKSVYIFDDLDNETKASIEDDYSWPAPMVDKDLYELDFPPGFGSRHWIGIGERGTGTSVHKDPFGTDAWNSLISGYKWWVLYPHNAVEDSYVVCDETCSDEDLDALDWFMSVGRHAARTPFGTNLSPMHVMQKPGETIYVPDKMYHAVLNLEDAIAITGNFGSPGNIQRVWEQVVRKGTQEQYMHLFDEVFTDEQREAVMEGETWPPEDYHGIILDNDNDDFRYSYNHEVVMEEDDGEEVEEEDDSEEVDYEGDGEL